MIREYNSVVELCEHELNGIKTATFRRNKDKYISDLEKTDYVEVIGQRNQRFRLVPKEQTDQQLADTEFVNILGCDIGGKDIELLKFILKSIIERKIVPGQDEIAYHANRLGIWRTGSRGSVKNYIGFLKDNGIIEQPMRIPVWIENPIKNRDGKEICIKREYDSETGEILPTYYKKIVKQSYFDCLKTEAGVRRKRINEQTQRAMEMAFENIWPDEEHKHILPLYVLQYSSKYINDQRMILKSKIIREIGRAYGYQNCNVMEEPIINPTIKQQLKKYFHLT